MRSRAPSSHGHREDGGGTRESGVAVAEILGPGDEALRDPRYLVPIGILWGIAGVGHLVWPAAPPAVWLSLWLPLLVPPFLLAYLRGPAGAAVGVLVGWLFLAATGLLLPALAGDSAHPWLVAAVAGVLGAEGAGAGWIVARLGAQTSRAVHLALLDTLTGLPNRRVLELFLEKEFARARRGRELTVTLLGVDGLGRINEELGREAGDYCLREVAGRLAASSRSMDVLGRFDDDRFLVVLSGERGPGGVRCADRLCRSVREAVPEGGRRLTVSAGVAPFAPRMAEVRDLLEAADRALRAAKSLGGDHIVLNEPSLSPAEIGDSDVSFWLLEAEGGTRRIHAVEARRDASRVPPSPETVPPAS